jgi:hypothetical protein
MSQDRKSQPEPARTAPAQNPVQGEGDYEAARRYRKEVADFEAGADIDALAHEAAPKSPEEEREFSEAEDKGRAHAKGNDASDAAIMAGKKPSSKN